MDTAELQTNNHVAQMVDDLGKQLNNINLDVVFSGDHSLDVLDQADYNEIVVSLLCNEMRSAPAWEEYFDPHEIYEVCLRTVSAFLALFTEQFGNKNAAHLCGNAERLALTIYANTILPQVQLNIVQDGESQVYGKPSTADLAVHNERLKSKLGNLDQAIDYKTAPLVISYSSRSELWQRLKNYLREQAKMLVYVDIDRENTKGGGLIDRAYCQLKHLKDPLLREFILIDSSDNVWVRYAKDKKVLMPKRILERYPNQTFYQFVALLVEETFPNPIIDIQNIGRELGVDVANSLGSQAFGDALKKGIAKAQLVPSSNINPGSLKSSN